MIDSIKCEVFNASYEPLNVISARDALVLIFKGKADLMQEHPTFGVMTVKDIFPLPIQIRLREMVDARGATRKPAKLTQHNLFVRDKWTCQYCGRHKKNLKPDERLTRDHVHPQSKGGKDIWKNVVTACSKCNNKKADYMLEDIGMVLLKEPNVPTVFELWSKSFSAKHKIED